MKPIFILDVYFLWGKYWQIHAKAQFRSFLNSRDYMQLQETVPYVRYCSLASEGTEAQGMREDRKHIM